MQRERVTWHRVHMRKQIKHLDRPEDINQLAHHLVSISTQEGPETVGRATTAQISLVMAEFGRKGGKIGGKRRLETMTPKQRQSVARKAARARWKKKKKRTKRTK